MMEALFLMIAGHALCDYPLQGDFLANAKNHRKPTPGVPWWIALQAHAAIHAGAVCLITGSVWLGLAEFVAHCAIDYGKCDGRFGFKADQAMHVACKVAWIAFLASGIA